MKIWTREFWSDASERAVKTAAQTGLGVLVAGQTLLTIDWAQAGAVVGTATLASILTSVVSSGVGESGTASALASVGRHRKE